MKREGNFSKILISVESPHPLLPVVLFLVRESERGTEAVLCFLRLAAQADLCWHAARVETLDLMRRDEVLRIPSHTGLRGSRTKTVASADVYLRGSAGLSTLGYRVSKACPHRQRKQKVTLSLQIIHIGAGAVFSPTWALDSWIKQGTWEGLYC